MGCGLIGIVVQVLIVLKWFYIPKLLHIPTINHTAGMAALVLRSCSLVDHPGRRLGMSFSPPHMYAYIIYMCIHYIMHNTHTHTHNSCTCHQLSVPSRMHQAVVASARYKKPVEKPFVIQYVKLVPLSLQSKPIICMYIMQCISQRRF